MNLNFKEFGDFKKYLVTADIYAISILIIYTLLAVLFINQISNSLLLILINLSLMIYMLYSSYLIKYSKYSDKIKSIKRILYGPLILLIYSQVQNYIRLINPVLYDDWLIAADRFILGTDPTHFLYKFSNPLLNEYLQFAYMTYFMMPVIQGFELHFKRNEFKIYEFLRIMSFSFFMSYLFYFFLPAIGPRFTLHDFAMNNMELKGLWLADFFRTIVNTGGGIPLGSLNPADLVNRDCMPSGHTWMTITNIYLSFRYKSKFRFVFLIVGSSLIFATVFLRYHYVVDVIAGAIFAVLTLRYEPYLKRRLSKSGFEN